MTELMKPRVRQTVQNAQYTYNLNRRLHDVKTYPILSPQGSSIVLYGHENGVTVVWRGGRRLKPAKPRSSQSANKTNGSSNSADDVVMILDSDEDDTAPPASSKFVDNPEFETDPVEDAAGYPEVIQTLDLSLGTDVLHIAVLPILPRTAGEVSGDPPLLDERMVFAVTCATSSVYVITLPLTPPSHDSKAREELRTDLLAGAAGKGKWGEALIRLDGHFRPADGVAMTLVREASDSASSGAKTAARVVVAVHSKDASGILRLWDVPIDSSAHSPAPEAFQTEYLPSPLTSISFNPNPAHSTQLLAVASPQAIRIYDYALPSIPQDDISEGPWPAHGSWLVSLYPPFPRASTTSCSRKPIVGADWISHGRAILTLLADGQWGIWDVEGAGPLGNGDSNRLFGGKHSGGVRGAALTAFNASGQLEGTSPLRNAASQRTSFASSNDFNISGRRDPLASMLSGGPERLASVKGGVEVVQLPSSRGLVSGEESAVLWIGGSDTLVCVVPVVAKFWDTQVRRSAGGGVNLFSGAQPSRMVRVTELNAGLLGERCCGVGAVPKPKRRLTGRNSDSADAPLEESTGLPVEVLIRGESRLVIVQDYQDVDTAPLRLPTQKMKRLEIANKPLEPVNAIIVHPRPDAPKIQGFENLSIRPSTRGSAAPQSVKLFAGSFGPSQQDDFDEPMDFRPAPINLPTRPRNMGLEFMDDLDAAADAGYELDAEERDVEQEVMDLMELDSQLEQMEEERQRGTKRVFFEEGQKPATRQPGGSSTKQHQQHSTRAESNLAKTGEKRVRFEDQQVHVSIELATPPIKLPPPTLLQGKNVFLESYSNSPEWTRFENPVVYMEEEILPEELEGDNPHQQLQDEELSMARHEGREPEFEHNQSRRHPLSQVTNAVDIVSLLPNRMQPQNIGQQGDGRPGTLCFGSDDDQENKEFFSDDSTYDHREHAPIIISDDNVEEEAPLDDEGDYGEEEPQDDTFEFLLKHGSKS